MFSILLIENKNERCKEDWNRISKMIKAGMDEAGRGSLISRVYAAVTVLPDDFMQLCESEQVIIRDSKKMTPLQRKRSRQFIEKHAMEYNVQWSDVEEIDQYGIQKATMKAMHRCVDKLYMVPDKLFIDGEYYENHLPSLPYECIIRGDALVPEIACASILAKTYRDEFIEKIYEENQNVLEKYGVYHNKGYGTKVHMDALRKYGFTDFHRKSFCKQSFSLLQGKWFSVETE